jgi:hypothetical protein
MNQYRDGEVDQVEKESRGNLGCSGAPLLFDRPCLVQSPQIKLWLSNKGHLPKLHSLSV